MKNNEILNRREFLKAGIITGVAAAGCAVAGTAKATSLMFDRSGSFDVSFRNVHTGESFSGVYRVGDRYLPEAFDRINHVLRDFRTNEEFPIDPRIIDMMYMVRHRAGKDGRFEVLSGYRSPKTNDKLRKASSGVAKRSLHMTGQAIDLRLPGYKTYELRKHAINLQAGGVGYYRGSDFVHMDTGRVRQW